MSARDFEHLTYDSSNERKPIGRGDRFDSALPCRCCEDRHSIRSVRLVIEDGANAMG